MADATTGQVRSAAEAAEARAYGLTRADLVEWERFSPIEIYWARKHHLTPAVARHWAAKGLRVGDAVRATALGMTPEEVAPWAGAGFAPFDAVEAKEAGVPLETAIAWLQAGFILPDAALLIRDGWTLEEAVTARYAGIAAEDHGPFPVPGRMADSAETESSPLVMGLRVSARHQVRHRWSR